MTLLRLFRGSIPLAFVVLVPSMHVAGNDLLHPSLQLSGRYSALSPGDGVLLRPPFVLATRGPIEAIRLDRAPAPATKKVRGAWVLPEPTKIQGPATAQTSSTFFDATTSRDYHSFMQSHFALTIESLGFDTVIKTSSLGEFKASAAGRTVFYISRANTGTETITPQSREELVEAVRSSLTATMQRHKGRPDAYERVRREVLSRIGTHLVDKTTLGYKVVVRAEASSGTATERKEDSVYFRAAFDSVVQGTAVVDVVQTMEQLERSARLDISAEVTAGKITAYREVTYTAEDQTTKKKETEVGPEGAAILTSLDQIADFFYELRHGRVRIDPCTIEAELVAWSDLLPEYERYFVVPISILAIPGSSYVVGRNVRRGEVPNEGTDDTVASRDNGKTTLGYRFDVGEPLDAEVFVYYASLESRPIDVTFDGQVIATDALSEPTGGVDRIQRQKITSQPIKIEAGSHFMSIDSTTHIPNITMIEFVRTN